MNTSFGQRIRELRQASGLTLRALAEAAGVDFTYLSKIENGKTGYLPSADTIRAIAAALGADSLNLLELAKKMPPEIGKFASTAQARHFFERAQRIASPDDWKDLLEVLERKQKGRDKNKK